MNIVRIAKLALPLLLISHAAFADSEDKKKRGATEAPTEEPKAEETPAAAPAPKAEEPAPAVGTTETTGAFTPAAETAQPKPARERSPVAERWSAEPLIGYGTADYNVGVGGRFGYTFETPVYLGATFMWYGGEVSQATTVLGTADQKRNFYYPAIETGYDFGIGAEGRFLIRPYAGFGVLFDRQRALLNNVSAVDTSTEFMLYPAVTARYNIPGLPVYAGVDTRLVIPVVNTPVSYQGFFVAGASM